MKYGVYLQCSTRQTKSESSTTISCHHHEMGVLIGSQISIVQHEYENNAICSRFYWVMKVFCLCVCVERSNPIICITFQFNIEPIKNQQEFPIPMSTPELLIILVSCINIHSQNIHTQFGARWRMKIYINVRSATVVSIEEKVWISTVCQRTFNEIIVVRAFTASIVQRITYPHQYLWPNFLS